jgi:hypothetical protein
MSETKKPARRTTVRKPAARKQDVSGESKQSGKSLPSQAVVIIHGMGEQRPMDTLRGFVRAVWSTDLSLTDPWPGKRTVDPDTGLDINKSWIVPDQRTGSYELRRITTPGMKDGERRTDFYELYWADLLRETPLKRLIGWLKGLLLRPWSQVPDDARGLYIMACVVLAIGVLPTLAMWFMGAFGGHFLGLPNWVWAIAAWFVTFVASSYLLPYLGDVADYVRATPDTVGRRADIRNRGLELLERLNNDPTYDRIVLVGHSLGSVIAYDLLQFMWVRYGPSHRNEREDKAIVDILKAIGEYARPLGRNGTPGKPIANEEDLARYRALQWGLYKLLRATVDAKEKPWKISDFVTVGSPLTHAEFLIARNESALDRAFQERLFASSPPISDSEKKPTIIYKDKHAHHASVFAATRWTNIYDLGNQWSTGDPFSGKVARHFGQGIRDVRVELISSYLGFRSRLFTHTFYWTDLDNGAVAPPHIVSLREAVDLKRALESATK